MMGGRAGSVALGCACTPTKHPTAAPAGLWVQTLPRRAGCVLPIPAAALPPPRMDTHKGGSARSRASSGTRDRFAEVGAEQFRERLSGCFLHYLNFP